MDIASMLPDGLTLTLLEDGTGSAQITPDYAEPLTWSETEGGIELSSSNFLYDPAWDAEKEILTLSYAADIVRIGFQKDGAAVTPAPTAALTPAPTTAAPPVPTESLDDGSTLAQIYTCEYFTAMAFPDTWEQDEFSTYDWDTYYSVQYNLNDDDGWSVSDVQVEASNEEVAGYRIEIDSLLEAAKAEGRESLDTLTIDGITFTGTVTGDYWTTGTYLARIPEASMTLTITISDPEEIEGVLPAILDSIHFTFPIPDPPLSDPPMPEDGVPYHPIASTATIGDATIAAQWLAADPSLLCTDNYSNGLAAVGDTVYVLIDNKLHVFSRSGSQLLAADAPVILDDSYALLSAALDGIVYITDGYNNSIAYLDGKMDELDLESYLVMHPSGQWGLAYWSSSDVNKITVTADGLATKKWVLTDLSDDTARQGRFSSVYYIGITQTNIFVAGTDVSNDSATIIAMYDFDGNELATFGSASWADDSYFGSVVGVVQTDHSLLVMDGFYQDFKLFSLDGTFLGIVDCDDLLGTADPWPIALVTSDSGALVMLSQEREDQSATELLVFEITGF